MSVTDAPPTPLVPVGLFHRLGLAVRGEPDEVVRWFERTLGAVSLQESEGGVPREGREGGPSSGETAVVLWLGDLPLAIFVVTGPGELSHFLDRNGPGMHSVAWSVDDNWTSESLLRQRGLRITGTSITGRHYYLHPRDTYGLLVELTDTDLHGDPREGALLAQRTLEPVVDVRRLERVTSVVRDADAAVAFYGEVFGATVADRGVTEHGDGWVDLRVTDVTLRLVQPAGGEGPFSTFLTERGERMHSYTVAVPDLAAAREALAAAGITVAYEGLESFWTDPATTFGMTMEWVQA